MADILIISTAHDRLGDTGNKTGVWFEELAKPYFCFRDAGHAVTLATLEGREIPIDPNSDLRGDDAPEAVTRFREDGDAMKRLKSPTRLADHAPEDFDAIFIPGGHGAMWDLADSDQLAEHLGKAWAAGKILASVCHGPAAFVNLRESDGRPVVDGRKLTAFSDSEEEAAGLTDAVPFLLESRLRDLGARFEAGEDWKPKAVAHGRLVTGQNPASSGSAADLVLGML